jgi:hypothetical protein
VKFLKNVPKDKEFKQSMGLQTPPNVTHPREIFQGLLNSPFLAICLGIEANKAGARSSIFCPWSQRSTQKQVDLPSPTSDVSEIMNMADMLG